MSDMDPANWACCDEHETVFRHGDACPKCPEEVMTNGINTSRLVRAAAKVPEVCMHNVKLGQGCFCPHCPMAEYGHETPQLSNQHFDDDAVDEFAIALKDKLAAARAKGRYGWRSCTPEELTRMLREHVEKGDPRDVANFCMFLWSLGARIGHEPSSNAGEDIVDLLEARGDELSKRAARHIRLKRESADAWRRQALKAGRLSLESE